MVTTVKIFFNWYKTEILTKIFFLGNTHPLDTRHFKRFHSLTETHFGKFVSYWTIEQKAEKPSRLWITKALEKPKASAATTVN